MEENKLIVRQIVHAILFLAKPGLPFRGDHENLSGETNPGNFSAVLKVFAEHDELLSNHLSSPRAKNATYLSPKSQNELINIIGYDIIISRHYC